MNKLWVVHMRYTVQTKGLNDGPIGLLSTLASMAAIGWGHELPAPTLTRSGVTSDTSGPWEASRYWTSLRHPSSTNH